MTTLQIILDSTGKDVETAQQISAELMDRLGPVDFSLLMCDLRDDPRLSCWVLFNLERAPSGQRLLA